MTQTDKQISTESESTQTANENITILEDSNTPAPAILESANIESARVDDEAAWENDARKGDPRYYQSGKKRGMMRPGANVSGIDAELARGGTAPYFFSGAPGASSSTKTAVPEGAGVSQVVAEKPAPKTAREKMAERAEMALIEARASQTADQAIMMLSMVNTMVSGGNYTAPEKARAETHAVFKNYALMHNLTLPPWLEVSFTAFMFTAPAFMVRPAPNVPSVGEKVKRGIGGWFAQKIIGRFFK